MAAHFELHIEQSPLLEASRREIGIVKGVQVHRWYMVEVAGRAVPHGDDGFREPRGSAARGGEDGVAVASAGDGACGAGVDGDSEPEARLDEYGAQEREV